MATHAYNMGNIYENSESKPLRVYLAQEAKIQGSGSGTYKVYGRLTENGAAVPLTLIDASTYELTDKGSGDGVYICDVSGLHSIFADEVSGAATVYARIFAGE